MVQFNLSLLLIVAIATILPTLALPYHHARHEDTDAASSAFSPRFYGGDPIVVTRDVGVDLQRRLFNWFLHPFRTRRERRMVDAMTDSARADAKAKVLKDRVTALLGSPTRREYVSAAFAERSFDDFDLETRDFEEEY